MKDILIGYYNPVEKVFSLFRPFSPPYSMIRISGKSEDLRNFNNIQHCRGGFFDTTMLDKYSLTHRIID